MTTDLKPEWSPDEPLVRGSLEHSADLLKAARTLFDARQPHFAYHLALLALEEIGKLEVVLMGRVGTEEEDEAFKKKFLDDHVGKIFWAFWGPSFTSDIVDPQQIQWHQDLAKQLHDKRLRGLYVEPGNDTFISPSKQVSMDEAKNLIELAEARLEMQREHKPAILTDEEKGHLSWFRAARYDSNDDKKLVLCPASQRKLAEFGNVRDWMEWLHDEADKRDAELQAFAENEMKREIVEGDFDRPKWKFRIRLKTNSHLIRPKAIKAWNKMDTPIKWYFVDKKKTDQLIVEFMLPKSVHASKLYDVGLAFAYRFIVALNIGTNGFFWFDMPAQTERFDESIEDMETRALLHVGRVPVRRVERKVEPISDSQILWTAMAFGLLPNEGPQLQAFRQYLTGLVYWAKTDVHSGFEVEAFRAFFGCFRTAMLLYDDWDGKISFADAATAVLSPHIRNVEETVEEFIALADKYVPGQPIPEVNIEQAAVMKLMTDVYLMSVLDGEAQRRRDAHVEGLSNARTEEPTPPPRF